MDKKPLDQFYIENEKLIHFAALKAMKRFKAAGLEDRIEYDDVCGRLREVFIKSYNGFDPEKSAFSTYFVRSATNAITSMIEDMYRLDIKMDFASDLGTYDNGEEESNFQDDVFKCDPMIDRLVELEDSVKNVIQNLSPLAQAILKYTIVPPDFIEREFLAQRAQAEFAKSLGERTFHSLNLDIKFVANCLKNTVDSPSELNSIRVAVEEVRTAIKHAVSA